MWKELDTDVVARCRILAPDVDAQDDQDEDRDSLSDASEALVGIGTCCVTPLASFTGSLVVSVWISSSCVVSSLIPAETGGSVFGVWVPLPELTSHPLGVVKVDAEASTSWLVRLAVGMFSCGNGKVSDGDSGGEGGRGAAAERHDWML